MAIRHIFQGADHMGRIPSDAQDKFIIRLPDGMREQLKTAAEANDRTMTAEVVARLRKSFDKDEADQVPDFTATLFTETFEHEFETLRGQIRTLVDAHHILVAEVQSLSAKGQR
jgi:plasmid stability protein